MSQELIDYFNHCLSGPTIGATPTPTGPPHPTAPPKLRALIEEAASLFQRDLCREASPLPLIETVDDFVDLAVEVKFEDGTVRHVFIAHYIIRILRAAGYIK